MTERTFGETQEGAGPERGTQLALVSSGCAVDSKVPSCGDPLPIREAVPNYHVYPSPLAKYEEVVADPKLFKETLEKLHNRLGTKFMVPTIGGKELDLHRLFVEVSSRGGLEKVIRDRRWKDITAVFSFPSTATNASFVLRKYYASLIHHYEQIYFFGAKSWTSPPTATLPVQSSPLPAQGIAEPVQPSSEAGAQKRRRNTGDILHGGQVPQFSGVPNSCCNDTTTSGVRRRRRRKKTEMRKRDPSHPKPNRSGYNFFFAEQHARLKPLHPGKDREISRMIGELWNKLTEHEKAVYQERGVKDKERYRSEMEEYRERLKTMSTVISNVLPLQQRIAAPEVEMVETDSKTETEEADSKMETEEVDSKMETEEVDFGVAQFPIVIRNGDDSNRPDSKVPIIVDKSLEPEISLAGGSGTESGRLVNEPAMEENGFELRRRVNGGDRKALGSSSGDAVASAKEELSGEGL